MNENLIARNRAALDRQFETVWHGGQVDESGSRGGLLPPYDSTSSWSLVENELRTRLDAWAKKQLLAMFPAVA